VSAALESISSFPAPALERLRANDEGEWRRAYPLLWQAVMAAGRGRLTGGGGDLENIASELLCHEIIPGVMGAKGESFAALASFDDLLRLARAVMVRRCIDEIRRQCRRKEDSYAEVPEREWLPAEAAGDGRTWPEWMSLIQRELQPPDPDLFHDRFALGLTTREIARRRGIPHGTVVSRFARALKRLSILLQSRSP
jgi:hypothetical protein